MRKKENIKCTQTRTDEDDESEQALSNLLSPVMILQQLQRSQQLDLRPVETW